MPNRHLTSSEVTQLSEAIDNAFSIGELNDFLMFVVDQTLDDVVLLGSGMQKQSLMIQVAQYFNRRNQATILLGKALQERPTKAELLTAAKPFDDLESFQNLSNRDLLLIAKGLSDAFTIPELDLFLQDNMSEPLDNIVLGAPVTQKAYLINKTVQYFNRRNQAQDIVVGAIQARPDNAQFIALGQALGLVAGVPDEVVLNDGQTHTFERIVNQELGIADFGQWLRKAAQIQHKICQVEIPIEGERPISGTGFLVAPDVVITNYHVVMDVINGAFKAETVRLRFDYNLLDDGITVSPGTVYQLAADWLIAASEPDWEKDGGGQFVPDPTKLDYALLRLQEDVGNMPIGSEDLLFINASARGWFKLPSKAYQFTANEIIIIVQHPDRDPISIALDTVVAVNDNRTRVRYQTNTEKGSSGSPCFDGNWNPVALHHIGDVREKPEYNQGIPLYTIVQSLPDEAKQAVGLATSS